MNKDQNPVFYKTILFVMGTLMGILGGVFGTLIYLEIPFELNGTLITTFVLTASTVGLFIATVVLAKSTTQLASSTKKNTEFTEGLLDKQENMLSEQRKTMEKDRLIKEMDLLVAPLYSKIGNDDFFSNKELAAKQHMTEYSARYTTFNEVKKYTYLDNTGELRLAITNYLKCPSEDDGSNFETVRDELYKALKQRYNEIIEELVKLN